MTDDATSLVRYPATDPRAVLLVLAHGAGAGQRHPFMVRMAEGLAARGIDVVTFDFPYMQQRRKVPDKAPVLEACFREVIERLRATEPPDARRLFIGGKSMGGRMATHLAAQGVDGLAGVVVFGYPLHPPGNPGQLRVSHLPAIQTPVLIMQGERDTFGTPAELEVAIRTMTAPVTLHPIPGGDHSLAVRSSGKDAVFDGVVRTAAAWILDPVRGAQ